MNPVDVANFWKDFARDVPILLVFIVGFIVALLRISRDACPSILTLIGCGTVLLSKAGSVALRYLILTGDNLRNVEWFRLARQYTPYLFTVGLALILVAVFVGRKPTVDVGERNP